MDIPFSKYHALGNDFLVIQRSKSPGRKHWKTAQIMCQRHTGVGADGIVCLSPSRVADYRIDIYNADGGWAEKSGNGLRIAGVWSPLKNKRRKVLTFEIPNGVAKVQLMTPSADQTKVSSEIGEPDFRVCSLPMKYPRSRCINGSFKVGRTSVHAICLSVGNPHVVVPVDQFDFDWRVLGAEIENAPIFPRGVNVEFVRVNNRKRLEVMEWERGVGETGSSGTGAAAAVAAMAVLGRVGRICAVHFPAGDLQVEWRSEDNILVLSGPVSYVMKGIYRAR